MNNILMIILINMMWSYLYGLRAHCMKGMNVCLLTGR